MPRKILLTSFQTWLPHQKSNSSEDLLEKIHQQEIANAHLTFLRKLPVNIPQASIITINKIETLKPDRVICCGMAESRQQLTLESNATCGKKSILTSVDWEKLVAKLGNTEISHKAGKFVCEGLYFNVLQHLKKRQLPCLAIFVHVPVLTGDNLPEILADFRVILQEV